MDAFFDDTKTAFALKSDTELERAYFLFKLIASEPLVRIGTAMTNFAVKAHLPVEGLIRATVFDHFCGGVNEKDCISVVDKLYSKKVYSILDYSVEGKEVENQFDFALEKILFLLEFTEKNQAIPYVVFKPTAFGRLDVYKKVSERLELSQEDQQRWNRIVSRYELVCAKAAEKGIPILIDAEESWMQTSVDYLVLDMMRKFNREKAIVYNTAQLYRWDRLDYLKDLAHKAKTEGFKIGVKIVRGAYMEKENEHAKEKGFKSPICKSKLDTDINFDAAIEYIVKNIDVFYLYLGTHNEKSVYKLLELMERYSIEKNDERIWFGQLYGMSDNITFKLAEKGYMVSKYMPYGPVRDVMPYLIRRAEENTSVAGQTNRELQLIKKEIDRRKHDH